VTGSNGGPGRKVGSRNRLGEQYISDLKLIWEEEGLTALRRCAVERPAEFVRVIASLLPRDVNLNMTATLDAVSFAERFRAACSLLHEEQQPKIIEHADARLRR
jgi:hypothetical protein